LEAPFLSNFGNMLTLENAHFLPAPNLEISPTSEVAAVCAKARQR
jgi:hypothetical protein